MNRVAAQKLVSQWKEISESLMKDNEYEFFFLSVFLPIDYVEKINFILLENDQSFDDFMVDAKYAYILINKLQEETYSPTLSLKTAKEFAKEMVSKSPYKDDNHYIRVEIAMTPEELDVFRLLYQYELRKNNISIDDMFVKFVDCYEQIDPTLLEVLYENDEEKYNDDNQKKN